MCAGLLSHVCGPFDVVVFVSVVFVLPPLSCLPSLECMPVIARGRTNVGS